MAERPAHGWTEAELARVRWILHEQQPALELLLRSARFDDFHLGRSGRRVHHEEIEVMNIVKGLRLLVLEARLADADGRFGDAIAALTTVGRSVDGLLKTPTVATWIIGSAATRWTAWAAADLVRNPCADPSMLTELRGALPREDPLRAGDATLARAVIEVADEKLAYIEDRNDPSVGWSVPFWIPNHFLFEDLIVAELVDRWDAFLELGHRPAAGWSIQDDPSDSLVSPWPGWFAMTGDYRPNLLSARSRAQAAASELQQLDLAVEMKAASPAGLDRTACDSIDTTAPTALTGGPVICRYDERNSIIVLEIPGATDVLQRFSTGNNRVGYLPPIELPVGPRSELCSGL